jgi:hypothetical protein
MTTYHLLTVKYFCIYIIVFWFLFSFLFGYMLCFIFKMISVPDNKQAILPFPFIDGVTVETASSL